jgi:hypothetical protein
MNRFYYRKSIEAFLGDPENLILGVLASAHEFSLEERQKNAWVGQIRLLKSALKGNVGELVFEYSIPRMGKRIDCVIIAGSVIFALEFKVGAEDYPRHAIDQVVDYALDLKNFHAQSHNAKIIPILIATSARSETVEITFQSDGVSLPVLSSGSTLSEIIASGILAANGLNIDVDEWVNSIYSPTPTIVEAAQALYRGHAVEEISRSDSGAINLTKTVTAINHIIDLSKDSRRKSICFLTGVPGAGKTLAGLNLAHSRLRTGDQDRVVFLSGNGPLVSVLVEALARDEITAQKSEGTTIRKGEAVSRAKTFIQNIHHFRDDSLRTTQPPIEKVVIFDEAQRAWTQKQTAAFMRNKKGLDAFPMSEPEFLISVMDRHSDWATIVCLIGGGQEINTGEAGLQEWFESLHRSFPEWQIHISSKLVDPEYTLGVPLLDPAQALSLTRNDDLHLSVSLRSFRSEKVARFVRSLLDCEIEIAALLYQEIREQYPIYLTRDVIVARNWLRSRGRGTERYGLIASSGGLRLKSIGIDVKNEIDPVHWFLNDRSDVRSSFYLEDVATEFDVQGLELDWACVLWDADLMHNGNGWVYRDFKGTKWQAIKDENARRYLKNAYRVLLTRARQGMMICVPDGSTDDFTRQCKFYDETFAYLSRIGLQVI